MTTVSVKGLTVATRLQTVTYCGVLFYRIVSYHCTDRTTTTVY